MNRKLPWTAIIVTIGLVVSVASAVTSFIASEHTAQTLKYLQAGQDTTGIDISEADLKEWATELASDDYEGRQAGYDGNNKAARYIAKKFNEMGIKPAGDWEEIRDKADFKRSYFQRFLFGNNGLSTQNVVGMIEGSDPVLRNQVVVLGAHFDHVGKTGVGNHYARLGRTPGTFHGADDNASGTVTVMAIAKAFAQGKVHSKRTVLFILFSAEEGGLIGSKYFCEHPTIGTIRNYVFMLNLDMIGRNPDQLVEIKGMASAGDGYLDSVVKEAVSKTKLPAAVQQGAEVDGGDSDHSSFGDQGVPFIFFFTGFHPDYHRVTDTADKLAYGHMALIGKTAMWILHDIADKENAPVFRR